MIIMFEFSDISCILMLLQRFNFFCEFLPAKPFFVFSSNSFSCFHYRCGARQWRLTQKIHAMLQQFFHFTKYFCKKLDDFLWKISAVLRVRRTEMDGDKLSTLFEVAGTLSVIRTTNGQIPHEKSLKATPPLVPPPRSSTEVNRLLVAAIRS